MEEEHATRVADEAAAIAKYDEDVARINGILDNLAAQQEALEFEISELDKCIIV